SFHGAAGTVTGSKYLINVNGKKILVDCGMFQGSRELRLRNWNPPPFEPSEIEAIIITHSHVDHIGYLPKLVREGFSGAIYATPPTMAIGGISLLDTAHLLAEDAEYRNKKKLTRHEKALPLFTTEDVEAARKLLVPVPFNSWVKINEYFQFRYHDAGHILGATSVELALSNMKRETSVLFSGDVGRYNNPMTNDPSEPPECDYLVCESTYGGRLHPPEDPDSEFINIIHEVIERKCVLLIPAFAVGRTQQIIYLVNRLIKNKRIPPINIHVDSPMGISVTDIYAQYSSYRPLDMDRSADGRSTLEASNVFFHRDRKESKLLNRLKGPGIIISASGMMVGGRILHHLLNRLPDTNTIMALVGYMAEGTLGRQLMDGETTVYIHKTMVRVRAKIVTIYGLSAHADYSELLRWLQPFKRKPRRVFVTHGEISQSEAMAGHLKKERGWDCLIPTLDQTVEL
ncbi:MAG: MBL fold metallo-hydrolase, partial [candidate division Zixibacteria bacterium]|nr:MBL fold metallo-hydrolase [candidate division Zixibacteria bacterium]